jgi:hypothetical protein
LIETVTRIDAANGFYGFPIDFNSYRPPQDLDVHNNPISVLFTHKRASQAPEASFLNADILARVQIWPRPRSQSGVDDQPNGRDLGIINYSWFVSTIDYRPDTGCGKNGHLLAVSKATENVTGEYWLLDFLEPIRPAPARS